MNNRYVIELLSAMNAADNCLITMAEVASEYIEVNGEDAELAPACRSIRDAAERAQTTLFNARDGVRALVKKLGLDMVGGSVDH